KGRTLFNEGEPCENVYRIISGRCESHQAFSDGTIKHLTILGPDDYIGEPDFSGHRLHDASARVITDSVLQRIPCADLRALLNGDAFTPVRDNAVAADVIDEFPTPRSGRIIVTFSISQNLPNNLLVEKLAQSLFAETAQSVLLLRIVSRKQNTASAN